MNPYEESLARLNAGLIRSVTARISDGTDYTCEFKPGCSTPSRVTIIPPNGQKQVIDYYPDQD